MSKANDRNEIIKKILNLELSTESLIPFVKYGLISIESYDKYRTLLQKRDSLNENVEKNKNLINKNEKKIKLTYFASSTNIDLFVNGLPIEKQNELIKTSEYQKFAREQRELEESQLALEKEINNLNIEINSLLDQLNKEFSEINNFNQDLDLSCYAIFCKNHPHTSSVKYSECLSYICSAEYFDLFIRACKSDRKPT